MYASSFFYSDKAGPFSYNLNASKEWGEIISIISAKFYCRNAGHQALSVEKIGTISIKKRGVQLQNIGGGMQQL